VSIAIIGGKERGAIAIGRGVVGWNGRHIAGGFNPAAKIRIPLNVTAVVSEMAENTVRILPELHGQASLDSAHLSEIGGSQLQVNHSSAVAFHLSFPVERSL
jgi:hypothetical protein